MKDCAFRFKVIGVSLAQGVFGGDWLYLNLFYDI